MKVLDRVLGFLMIVSALLHCAGSFAAYKDQPMALLWAVSGGLAEILLAALNLLRAGRPHDRPLASVTLAGNVAWLVLIAVFGELIHNLLDFRVIVQAVITIALIAMSLRTLLPRNKLIAGVS